MEDERVTDALGSKSVRERDVERRGTESLNSRQDQANKKTSLGKGASVQCGRDGMSRFMYNQACSDGKNNEGEMKYGDSHPRDLNRFQDMAFSENNGRKGAHSL